MRKVALAALIGVAVIGTIAIASYGESAQYEPLPTVAKGFPTQVKPLTNVNVSPAPLPAAKNDDVWFVGDNPQVIKFGNNVIYFGYTFSEARKQVFPTIFGFPTENVNFFTDNAEKFKFGNLPFDNYFNIITEKMAKAYDNLNINVDKLDNVNYANIDFVNIADYADLYFYFFGINVNVSKARVGDVWFADIANISFIQFGRYFGFLGYVNAKDRIYPAFFFFPTKFADNVIKFFSRAKVASLRTGDNWVAFDKNFNVVQGGMSKVYENVKFDRIQNINYIGFDFADYADYGYLNWYFFPTKAQ